MPGLSSRKRRAEPEEIEADTPQSASPEPPQQRRRTSASASPDYDQSNETALNLEELARKLVRLALACEYQRRPLRRQEIGDKVLGNAGRQFKKVFAQAQMELRSVFGMEMVELPAKERITVAQRRAAQQKSDKAKAQTTTWVLISILPKEFQDPAIISPSAIPTSEEDSKYTAIYTLLVSLVALSGGSVPEAKMERYLRRMQMEDSTPVDGFEKTEKLFKRLERDGYLVKVKESIGAGGEEEVSWIIGPRSKVEVGDEGVKGLTEAVYGDLEEQGKEDLSRKIARSLGLGNRPDERTRERQALHEGDTTKRRRPGRSDPDEDESDDSD